MPNNPLNGTAYRRPLVEALDTKREIEIFRVTTDGKRDTQLFEQIYAKRTTTRLRDAQNMKLCPKYREKGLYEPEKPIFGLFLTIFDAFRIKNSQETKKTRSNKAFHRTAHKLRQIYAFGTINLVAVTHYCACAPSGER